MKSIQSAQERTRINTEVNISSKLYMILSRLLLVHVLDACAYSFVHVIMEETPITVQYDIPNCKSSSYKK
jgi:hypothetical protein